MLNKGIRPQVVEATRLTKSEVSLLGVALCGSWNNVWSDVWANGHFLSPDTLIWKRRLAMRYDASDLIRYYQDVVVASYKYCHFCSGPATWKNNGALGGICAGLPRSFSSC
jgi:hypothetical protein